MLCKTNTERTVNINSSKNKTTRPGKYQPCVWEVLQRRSSKHYGSEDRTSRSLLHTPSHSTFNINVSMPRHHMCGWYDARGHCQLIKPLLVKHSKDEEECRSEENFWEGRLGLGLEDVKRLSANKCLTFQQHHHHHHHSSEIWTELEIVSI